MDERERQREKWKGGEEEGEKKGETQRPMSTHLMLPAGPGDADGTLLLIHPSLQLVPRLLQSVSIPVALVWLYLRCSPVSSSSVTLLMWSLPCHTVRSADAYA